MRVKPRTAEEEGSWQHSVRWLMVLQSSFALVLLMVGAPAPFTCEHPVALSQPLALLMPQEWTLGTELEEYCTITLHSFHDPK